jgi:peroxiredoxin
MAQLRQDYDKFLKRGVEVLVVGPDSPKAYQEFWEKEKMPFPGLADYRSKTALLYAQEVNLFKFGRMPAVFLIDKAGLVRYYHYSSAMWDIPENEEIFKILDEMIKEKA